MRGFISNTGRWTRQGSSGLKGPSKERVDKEGSKKGKSSQKKEGFNIERIGGEDGKWFAQCERGRAIEGGEGK